MQRQCTLMETSQPFFCHLLLVGDRKSLEGKGAQTCGRYHLPVPPTSK